MPICRAQVLMQRERDVGRAQRNGEPLVVAFTDVDHLKKRSDTEGHAAGDQLLRQFVQRLHAQLRPHDLVIRYGGDEFVTVIAGLELGVVRRHLDDINSLLLRSPTPGTVTNGLAQLRPGDTVQGSSTVPMPPCTNNAHVGPRIQPAVPDF